MGGHPQLDFLISPQCLDVFLNKKDFLNAACLKALLSKALGYGTILGSFGLKVPQIVNILNAGSCEGISPLSFYSEVPLYSSTAIYNFLQGNPISSYGESVVVLIQVLILVGLLWGYSRPRVSEMLAVFSVCIGYASVGLMLPPSYQYLLPASGLPLMCLSRIPQIITNFQNKHTGPLSAATLSMTLLGSVARVFTTLQEASNPGPLLLNYGLSCALAFILLFQVFVYQRNTSKLEKLKSTKPKKD